MSAITVLPLNIYAANTYNLGPATIPTGITQAKLAFDLTHLTALTLVMDWAMQISFDGGTTWPMQLGGGLSLPRSGFTLVGGVIHDANGVVITETAIQLGSVDQPIPQPTNPQRRIKGSITISEAFQTIGTVTLL